MPHSGRQVTLPSLTQLFSFASEYVSWKVMSKILSHRSQIYRFEGEPPRTPHFVHMDLLAAHIRTFNLILRVVFIVLEHDLVTSGL
jgi:hypothetical protein